MVEEEEEGREEEEVVVVVVDEDGDGVINELLVDDNEGLTLML